MTRILIVDDEESICETLSWMLAKVGYDVTAVMEYEKAIQVIKDTEFDLFFIEIILNIE